MRIQHSIHQKAAFFFLGFFVIFSLSAGLLVNPVQAKGRTDPLVGLTFNVQSSGYRTALPSLRVFASSLLNGNAKAITGIYAPNLFALPVLQQPKGQPGFVSRQSDSVTLFGMAQNYGTIALLAHNDLSGALFFNLSRSQEVFLVYGDGAQKRYRITRIDSFQALQPDSPYSSFIDLHQPERTLSVEDLFYSIYASGDHLVFQTCIEKDGKLSWGRLFVTAEPAPVTLIPRYSTHFRYAIPQ
jgi:hypothetical protein